MPIIVNSNYDTDSNYRPCALANDHTDAALGGLLGPENYTIGQWTPWNPNTTVGIIKDALNLTQHDPIFNYYKKYRLQRQPESSEDLKTPE